MRREKDRRGPEGRKDVMTGKASELNPRREFLKLAALTGAATLAGSGPPAVAEGNLAASPNGSESKLEFLHASGRQILDAQGKKVRLRGTCPGGWMNMEDFINGYPGAEHTLRAQMAEVLGPA